MSFEGKVQTPPGFGTGQWNFVQRFRRVRHVTLRNENGQQTGWHFEHHGLWGLDQCYPYSTWDEDPYTIGNPPQAWKTDGAKHQTSDTPSMTLEKDAVETSMADDWVMWMMFKPPGVNSQWVPVRMLTWSVSVRVVRQGGAWQLDGAPVVNPSVPANFVKTIVFPQWEFAHKNTDQAIRDRS